MTTAFSKTGQGFFNLGFNNLGICQHDGRVKIALQGHALTHPVPGLSKRYGPVHTHSIATGIGNRFQV